MESKPEEIMNSDKIDPAMLAKQRFDDILDQVQTSCLNFQLQVSPFSAVISIKKSFIKDKSGKVFVSPQPRGSKEMLEKND